MHVLYTYRRVQVKRFRGHSIRWVTAKAAREIVDRCVFEYYSI